MGSYPFSIEDTTARHQDVSVDESIRASQFLLLPFMFFVQNPICFSLPDTLFLVRPAAATHRAWLTRAGPHICPGSFTWAAYRAYLTGQYTRVADVMEHHDPEGTEEEVYS